MKILNLKINSKIYTCNAYLITGTSNAIDDVNTMLDVGRDPAVMEIINTASTGVGKRRVEQVILTHSHYNHASLLPRISEIFKPVVYAFSQSLAGVDYRLKDGETLKAGDRIFEVIHTPGHSIGSICLYTDKNIFTGDTLFVGAAGRTDLAGGSARQLLQSIREKIYTLPGSTTVWPGHDYGRFPDSTIEREKETNSFTLGKGI